MSVILGNAVAVLLVAALVWISAREIYMGHKGGSCGGCSGDCGSCRSSCASSRGKSGKDASDGHMTPVERTYAVNGKIIKVKGSAGRRQ